jgi:pimeloyl-ACP methyl ester carboxylesterase
MPALFRDFGSFLNLGARAQVALAARVRDLTGRPLEDFVVAEQLARHHVPALVIHAPDDKEIPPREAESLARAGSHVELRWAPGLGHRRILSDSGVARMIADFLTDPEKARAA